MTLLSICGTWRSLLVFANYPFYSESAESARGRLLPCAWLCVLFFLSRTRHSSLCLCGAVCFSVFLCQSRESLVVDLASNAPAPTLWLSLCILSPSLGDYLNCEAFFSKSTRDSLYAPLKKSPCSCYCKVYSVNRRTVVAATLPPPLIDTLRNILTRQN